MYRGTLASLKGIPRATSRHLLRGEARSASPSWTTLVSADAHITLKFLDLVICLENAPPHLPSYAL
jgi:hypothetical protein